MERKLDRLPSKDARNFRFLSTHRMSALPMIVKDWNVAKVLDQGQEGACVGFGWAHEAIASPFPIGWVTDADARAFYEAARKVDEWEGEDYEGTSVLAGAKVAQSAGLIAGYKWTYNWMELALAVGYDGPAVIGVDWYSDMWDVDSSGFIHVSGDPVGGHCTLISGVDPTRGTFTIHNSWGESWGRGGKALISFDDMHKLLDTNGEACIPLGREWTRDPRERKHDLI